ncbi:ABC transporter permease subunit [Saccharomonospora sp. NPDC046836]|uniref:ABC transporter permease n=1 Tax=Saccharomonospora sp. NPDC046836 TaxID=3156921 RepID=UPI0033FA81D2
MSRLRNPRADELDTSTDTGASATGVAVADARTTASTGRAERGGVRISPRVGSLLIVLVLLVLLQLAGSWDIGGAGILPTTTEVAGALGEVLTDPATYGAIGATFTSWLVGFGIAVIGGVALGLLVGLSRFAARSTRGLFDFLRSTPAIAFIPMAVLLLGTGDVFKVSLIVFTCIWVILLQTTAGLRSIDAITLESARSLRMSRSQRIRWVLLPAALPYVLTGVRLAAVKGFLLSIGAELIAGADGLGQEILLRQMGGATAQMWAFVVLAAVLGVVVSLVFTMIESSALRWDVSQRVNAE